MSRSTNTVYMYIHATVVLLSVAWLWKLSVVDNLIECLSTALSLHSQATDNYSRMNILDTLPTDAVTVLKDNERPCSLQTTGTAHACRPCMSAIGCLHIFAFNLFVAVRL